MSEARTDTTQARPQEAAAQAEAAGSGRHRGPAAAAEQTQDAAHGRHRRDQQVRTA
ncbi:hypothetical protein MUU72_10185 [Streptomyces sp. RS10V-4]|uniref:hypothetical protein n=1 Tax=Streptomyces rhizoryzae TaxID=2932493 RepID=UPI002004FC02|nr:hypothetical protein [Streptomyces rhizoryzae]MCK7623459.1 hypothetical protein [Streptomyces rhizoryzae]